jgi:coproporphyrinogen III oxidase
MRERSAEASRALQAAIVARLEEIDGQAFSEEVWTRGGGGGGRSLSLTRSVESGAEVQSPTFVFEKAAVNFSEVHGELSEEFAAELPGEGLSFYATGISLVLHPYSPRVPTVHANFRYLEKGDRWWFGGGADLTPYRLYPEDARHFHSVWKAVCDRHDPEWYGRFKKSCDEYFYLPHRGEARGVGGIFFDDLTGDPERTFRFWKEAGEAFLAAYIPIAERRRGEAFDGAERAFQLERRGRYVEFNLLYDRGTRFGLRTGGRTESILMSLPPLVRWTRGAATGGAHAGGAGSSACAPAPRPEEAELLTVLRSPRDWLGEPT